MAKAPITGSEAAPETAPAETSAPEAPLAVAASAAVATDQQVLADSLAEQAQQPSEAETPTVPAPQWWISNVAVTTPEQGFVKANTPFLTAAPQGKSWKAWAPVDPAA